MVSRAYTLSGASSRARAAQTIAAVTSAIGSSQTNDQATAWRVITSTTAKATACRQKCTSAAPTLDSGSTARGKRTLPTSDAFDVIDCVADVRLVLTSVQTSRPQSTQMANWAKPAPRMAKTTEYTTSRNSGWIIDHVKPRTECW